MRLNDAGARAMPDHDGYPTEEELDLIRKWPHDARSWFEYIHECWHMAEWGWEEEELQADPGDAEERGYHISTGGWSGNEEIIDAMRANRVLWGLTWWSSRRGGHYEFRVAEEARDA